MAWRESLRLRRATNCAPASWLLPIHVIAARRRRASVCWCGSDHCPRLAARAHWLTVEWLPKYAPELNEIEPVWRDLKAHHLAHQTFTDVAALDQAIHDAVIDLNRERIPDPLAMPKSLLRSSTSRKLSYRAIIAAAP